MSLADQGLMRSRTSKDDATPLCTCIGEMNVCGFGGAMADNARLRYHVEVVLVRDWRKYMFDFMNYALLVFIAGCSIYVPLNDDLLANRLSITLAIVLTLV